MNDAKTCGTCKHWHRDPIDPNNMGAPRNGECRYGPPTPIGVPTAQGLSLVVTYPKVPSQFPACEQHAPIVQGG